MAVDYAALKKGGFMRQKQKNNFSLRLQVVGGNLTAENLKKIAEVAEKYGDGHVHPTSRQSVEIKVRLSAGCVGPMSKNSLSVPGKSDLSERQYRHL